MYRHYIYTFGKKTLKIKNAIPIELGMAKRECFIYPTHDNTGDNISNQNEYYGELTAMYWVWKNVPIANDDIIAFSHYNKTLNISPKRAAKWLEKYPDGVITIEPHCNRDHPVPDEVAACVAALKNSGKQYLEAWNLLYDEVAAGKGPFCRGGNMLICTGRTFKNYCEWFFFVLENIRKTVGDKPDVSSSWRRYCAFMGERLISVYIQANACPVKAVPTKYKEWWLPFVRKFAKTFNVNRNSKVYIALRNRFGYNSQYGRKN